MINKNILVNAEELERYELSVHSYLDGQIDADRFQSMRLQQGIYGQRQQGVNMVRIKIPGGKLDPKQAITIAEVLEQLSEHDVAHITTRQAIQIHYVPLAKTPAALRQLASTGLTTREACNNTVRNMSACPLTGVCPAEHTDISQHLETAAAHFLRHPLTQHLPRKFKISFSGCERDCAQGMIHDLAVVATRRHEQKGFKILAGGGLGHKPREAIVVEEFIAEAQLLASMEAVIALHNRYSDRKHRAKSRLKFLVDRFGTDGFRQRYRAELERTLAALANKEPLHGAWNDDTRPLSAEPGAPRDVLAQKQAGLNIVPIHIPLGDISGPQLRAIADIMQKTGLDDLRTTQDQNLTIVNVADDKVTKVISELAAIGLGKPAAGQNVVACPGTSTCRLGITSSKIIGAKLSGGRHDLRIRASGCHNGCAQPESGDIGIYGEGKRLHGKLIPHYQMYIGGDGRGAQGLAFKTRTIPTARIEQAIADIQTAYDEQRQDGETFFHWSHRLGQDYFDELLAKHAEVLADQVSTVLSDHGDQDAFHVLQLGGGECSGAAQETVAAHFAEAANERNYRQAFMLQRHYDASIECAAQALRLIGNSLLFLAGHPAVDDLSAIGHQIERLLPGSATLGQQLRHFAADLHQQSTEFDLASYTEQVNNMDQWMHAVAKACQDIDKQLDLSATAPKLSPAQQSEDAVIVDLSSFGCPLHYIKARNSLRQFQAGDIINFLFASGSPAEQASSSLQSDGHQLLDIKENGTITKVTVRKADQD